MKYFKVFVAIMVFILLTGYDKVSAEKSQELLERVATKVAELAENLKKAKIGVISSLKGSSFFIDDVKINTSEITDFYRVSKGTRTPVEFKDLKDNLDVTVIGTEDLTTKEILANQIIIKVNRVATSGAVMQIDKKKNLYTLSSGTKVEIDASTPVRKNATDSATFVKGKYSEIVAGDNLAIIGYFEDEESPLTALKTIIL